MAIAKTLEGHIGIFLYHCLYYFFERIENLFQRPDITFSIITDYYWIGKCRRKSQPRLIFLVATSNLLTIEKPLKC